MKSVFISSTFKDMQAERDLLHETVFPRLRRVMAEYGEDIQELDLRWGVDTANLSEEESGHAVLKVCIDAIDRCKPFFIVLLGERYGWIPGTRIVESVRDARISRYYEEEMSITNLEILYGALADEDLLRRCIFCFRDPSVLEEIGPEYRTVYEAESVRHQTRLAHLKRTIREKEDATILDYCAAWDEKNHQIAGLRDFGEAVYGLLAELIRAEYAGRQPGSAEEHLLREMQQTKERYLSSYIHRPMDELRILERCAQFLRDPKEQNRKRERVYVTAAAGTGKSALMAACAGALEGMEEKGWHSILYFAGNPGCQDEQTFMQVLCYRLEEILGQSHEERQGSLRERLGELNEKIGEKKIICFLDAAEQLTGEGEDRYLDVLSLCSRMYFVISALPDFPLAQCITGSGLEFVPVTPEAFPPENIRQMTEITVRRRGKKLDDVVSRAVQEKQGSGNPLYLSMLLQRLFMMDGEEFAAAEAMAPGMEGLHRYMMGLISRMPEDLNGMVRYLLEETGKHFDAEEFSVTAALLAESAEGLTEQELEEIFAGEGIPFSQIRFQQIVSYLYDGFAQRQDGKWNFAHRIFGEAVKEAYPEECRLAGEYLIGYARRDPAFFAREGYRYLLKGKCMDGVRILEQELAEQEQEKLAGLVGALLQSGEEYRAYFTEMAEKNSSSEGLAGFWSGFFEMSYGEDAVRAVQEIRDCFIKDPACPHKARFECCLTIIKRYRNAREEAKTASYQRLAEELAEQTEGEEGTFARARALVIGGDSEYIFGRAEGAQRLRRQAVLLLGMIKEPADSDMRERAAAMKAETVADLLWTEDWLGKQMEPGPAEEALQELRSCGCDRVSSQYARVCIKLLGLLATICSDRKYFDIKKATAYGKEGIALARACVEHNPSIDHLYELSSILAEYAWTRKAAYRYPYTEECMLTRRRILERERTPGNRKAYADGLLRFAKDADWALESGRDDLPQDLRERADRCWEESFAIYGELLEEGMRREDMSMYRFGLFARADVMMERRRYGDVIRYVRMGQSLLPEEGAYLDLVDQLHASRLLAEANLAMFREEEAQKEAKAALLLAERMAEQYPEKLGNRLATVCGLLAKICYRQHRTEEAFALCDRAGEAWMAYTGETGCPWRRAELDYIRGMICLERGEIAVAWEWDQRAFQRTQEPDAGKSLGFEEELFKERRWILHTELCIAEGDYREARTQWWNCVNGLKNYRKKAQELKEGETEYLLVLLDALTGYAYRRYGDALRQGGLVKSYEYLDIRGEAIAMKKLDTGGEIEYLEAYRHYRAQIGRYEKMERLGREVFGTFREMVLSLPDDRRCYAARTFAELLVKTKAELLPWERAFFQELLSGCDMSGTVSPEFWQAAVSCLDPGNVEAVLPANREGIGQACFVEEKPAEALQWMETVPVDPGSSAEVTCTLARCCLALQEGKDLPADKGQLEGMAEKLSKQNVTDITSCQIRVCYELLAALTEGKEQAEYIEETFGRKWIFALALNHYHRQHLRLVPLVVRAVEEGRYTAEQTHKLWKEVTWSAELCGKEGGFGSPEEKIRVWAALIHTFAGRLRETDEDTVIRGLDTLWEILTGEEGAWEMAREILTNDDIKQLLWYWENTQRDGCMSSWRLRTRLGLELYARTKDPGCITDLVRENRRALNEKEERGWYATIAKTVEENKENAATVETLAGNLWGLLRRMITKEETERAFWIRTAMEEFRLGVLPDGLQKEGIQEAAEVLGAYCPQCGEELSQMAEGWARRRLELYLSKNFCHSGLLTI